MKSWIESINLKIDESDYKNIKKTKCSCDSKQKNIKNPKNCIHYTKNQRDIYRHRNFSPNRNMILSKKIFFLAFEPP